MTACEHGFERNCARCHPFACQHHTVAGPRRGTFARGGRVPPWPPAGWTVANIGSLYLADELDGDLLRAAGLAFAVRCSVQTPTLHRMLAALERLAQAFDPPPAEPPRPVIVEHAARWRSAFVWEPDYEPYAYPPPFGHVQLGTTPPAGHWTRTEPAADATVGGLWR